MCVCVCVRVATGAVEKVSERECLMQLGELGVHLDVNRDSWYITIDPSLVQLLQPQLKDTMYRRLCGNTPLYTAHNIRHPMTA